jgi:hypothetical protein
MPEPKAMTETEKALERKVALAILKISASDLGITTGEGKNAEWRKNKVAYFSRARLLIRVLRGDGVNIS